jgi:hypothetical protein
MGGGVFGRKRKVVAHRLELSGEGTYEIPLEDSEYGLVFESSPTTGYLYITKRDFSEIYDALHLYDRGDVDEIRPSEEVFLVWSPDLQKAGFFYRGRFQAGVDFRKHEARCRSGFPTLPNTPWLRAGHDWNDEVVKGLEP